MTTIYKECPISIQYKDIKNGRIELTAEHIIHLVKTAVNPLYLVFVSPSDPVNEFSLEFRPNWRLFGESLAGKYPICHFEAVNPINEEYSTLSACNIKDINALIRINGKHFILGHSGKNFYFLTDSSGTCEWPNHRQKRSTERKEVYNKLPQYYSDYIDGVKRWVELIFIADNTIFKKYNEDEQRIHDRLHSIASTVNSLYAPLNVRIALVWADIWKSENPIEVTEDADKTLRDFLGYRKSLLVEHSHDNAHLLTDVRFGSVIGKAYKGTMCSYDYSGGVIVDHSENPIFVGMTVAHEMGHNFGMDHDNGPCNCPVDSCIMASSSNTANATSFFSDCSLDTLSAAMRRGVDYCLRNVPKIAFGGAKCGNGILEDGEDCDCGSTTSCPNKCCVASECKLAKEAACADGDCCNLELCQLKTMATVCRAATNICDLPEFCDGKNPSCPADFFIQDGHKCPDEHEDRCYQGICGSRKQQCQFIWGPTAENSAPECYAYNEYGSFSGNCGYNQTNEQYLRCNKEDVNCGRLQCVHDSDKPVFGDPSTVYSAYNLVKTKKGDETCRVIRTTFTGTGNRKADPGMVPDGAKCGRDRICVNSACRNETEVLQMVSRCKPEDCNDKGVCNNVGNCHCTNGYGGISCDLPGYGGSVNSGPANDSIFDPGMTLFYLALFLSLIFMVASIYCRRKKGFWIHKRVWSKLRVSLELRSFNLIPTRRAPPPPGTSIRHTHRQSWNAVWDDHPGNGEILCVDATRPYALGGARAVHKQQQRQTKQPVLNSQRNPVPTNGVPTSHPNKKEPTIVPYSKPPLQSGVSKMTVEEQRALVLGYDTGRSSSSSDDSIKKNAVKAPPVPPHRLNGSAQEMDGKSKPPKPAVPKKPTGIKKRENDNAEATDDSLRINVKAMAAKFDKN